MHYATWHTQVSETQYFLVAPGWYKRRGLSQEGIHLELVKRIVADIQLIRRRGQAKRLCANAEARSLVARATPRLLAIPLWTRPRSVGRYMMLFGEQFKGPPVMFMRWARAVTP